MDTTLSSQERRIFLTEKRLLGLLLRSPHGLARLAARLDPLDFQDYRHQLIWAAMLALHRRGATVTIDSVLAELACLARDDDAGGLRYLTWLARKPPASNRN